MKVFGLTLLIAILSLSAFAQARSGVEGVWKLSEISTSAPAAVAAAGSLAVPGAKGKPSVASAKASQPSIYIFTKTHYSIIYVASANPRPVLEDYNKASQEVLLSIFVDDFVANAGTYDIKAGKLTVHPTVAKSPSYMKDGTWSSYSMSVKGNTMTLILENSSFGPSKYPTTETLTRVE